MANRKRDDVFARAEDGSLIVAEVVSPPNAQLLVKMLASLVPGFAENPNISVTHAGRVLIEGDAQQPQAALPPPASFK